VIARIFPSNSDFENLSRLRTEDFLEANLFDYSKVVVRKPWGYEYLWYQTPSVAVWILYLKPGSATSMHCHSRKRTSLIVLSGSVECSTFDERHRLDVGKGIVLEPCVFHSTLAISDNGSYIMEVETPSLKGDLIRYRDNFGRVGKAYEGHDQHSTDFSRFNYRPLESFAHHGKLFVFHDVKIRIDTFHGIEDFSSKLVRGSLAVPFLGCIEFNSRIFASIGEAFPSDAIPWKSCPAKTAPVEILQISAN
jgi:mannose-6-phosphate isomerase-like protein (cupin superfamily)